ncbi:MAG: PAS domain S-box protein [Deltaproteobacteria bacterium]|nr:PAS domain S-box protein [Deltaproteobacteria bacterium]
MTDCSNRSPEFADLRRRAEERLKADDFPQEELSPAQAARLIRELKISRIELEIQHEELRLTRARLEESRSKYAALYDHSPVGYLTLDQQGRIAEANLTAAGMLGEVREHLTGRCFTHFLEQADRLALHRLMTDEWDRPEQRLEVRLHGGNGGERIILLDILSAKDAQGREQRRLTLTDITELKRTQEELRLHTEGLEDLVAQRVVELIEVNYQLRQSHEKLQAVIHHCPLAVVPLDTHGLVQGWNPAAERMFGWRADEAIGGFPPMVPEEKQEERAEILRRSLQGEQITGMELRRQRKDGTWIDVSLSVAPLRDEQGKVSGLVGILEDITERKRAEETLKTQAMVLASMAEGVIVTDDRGNILYTNPAFDAMFGYEPGELLGRHSHILSHYPPEENTRVVKEILRRVDTAGVWSGEFHNRRKDGSLLLTASRISAIKVGGKNLFISVQEDITARKAGEEALRAANERLQALINACPLAIMSLDTNGLVTAWNPAAERLFGWREQEVLGRPLPTVPEDAKEELEDLLRMQREGKFLQGKELRRLKRDGTPVEVRLYSAPLRNSQGTITGFIGVLEDITERQQAEDVLRRQAELLDLAHDAILVRDLTGRIIFWNQGATELYGFTPEEALGQLTFELLQTKFPVPLADIEAQILKEGSWQGVLRQTTKDGRRLVISSSRTLRRDEKGRPQSILVINTDITERQRAEEALRESEMRFRKIFENAATGIAIVDREGRYQQFNPAYCNLTGYTGEELLELNFASLVHPEDREANLAEFRRLKAGELPFFETENRLIRKDGRSVWVHKFISVLTDAAGKPSHLLGLITDTTERKLAEQALKESEARERARAAELQALFDAVPALVLLAHDPEARNVTGNSLAHEFFGVPPGGNISKSAPEEERPGNFRVFKDGLEIPPEKLPVRRAARGEPVRNYELDIVFTSGDRHSILGNAIPLRDDSGNPRGAVSAFIDITARKQAEEALRRSEEKYRTLFNSIDEGFCIIEVILDDNQNPIDYRFLEVNPSFARQTGLADAQGKRMRDLVPDLEEHWFEIYGRVALTGESARFQARAKPLHRWFDVYAFRFGQPQDRQVAVIFDDITARKRTEDALKERTERYELVVAGAHAGIWDWDVLNHRVFYSPQWKSLYGFDEDEVVDRPEKWSERIHPDDAPCVFIALQEHFAGTTPVFVAEYRIICPDGSIKWVMDRGIAQRDALGRVVRMAGSAADITPRKWAEEELARQKELLQAIIDNIPVMLTIYDPELKTIRLNQELRKVLGWTEEDLPADDPLAPFYPDLDYRKQVRQYMQSLEPGWRDLHVTAKDGSAVDSTWANIRLTDNTFIGIGIDIRERKRAEEALRESEARYRAVGELIPYGIWTANAHGGIEYISKSFLQMTGKTLEECQRYGWMYLLPEEDIEPTLADWQHNLNSGGFWDYEHKVRSKDGGYRTILSRGVPLTDDQGRITSWVGINLDITERKAMEEELRRARDELERRVEERTRELQLAYDSLRSEMEKHQRTADRLRESEARFSAFMRHLPGIAVMRDTQGRYLFANDTWERLLGKTKEDWLGKTVSEIWPADLAREFSGQDHHTLATGQSSESIKELDLAEGRKLYLTYNFPILDDSGLPYMVGAIGIDITERRRAEEARAEERQRLFSLLETMPAFVALLAPDYSMPFANQEFVRRFGEPEAGKPCYLGLFGRTEPCPDCRTFQVLETNQPQEWEWLGPDGRTYAVYDYPFTDTDGSPLVLEMGVDITRRKRAEEALAEHAALVNDLYNNAPCGYHSLDEDGVFVQINDTELNWLGYTRQEVLGRMKFSDLLTPEGLKTFQENYPLFKERGWVSDLEFELVRKDGSVLPVVLSASAIKDEAGKFLMTRSSVFDNTERKQAQEALMKNEAMLRLILDTLPVGVWVVDKDGRIVQSNPAARSIWGGALYMDGEQYGEYKAWWADTGQRLTSADWAAVRAVQKGETSLGEVINIECFDGSRKTILNSAAPLFGKNQEILGAIVVNEDITDLKRAEKVMLQQARQLEAFFSHNITPLVFLDPEFNFLRVNEAYARACQRDAQEFIGRNHFELYPDPEVEAIFRRVVETKSSYVALAKPFEFPDHPEWGVTYWDWSLAPILDEVGEVDFLVFSLNDVTERKRAELEAERQNALIAGINGIFREALRCETEEELAATCLAVAEELTGSEFGFIDELNEAGNLDALAFSGAALKQCSLAAPGDVSALQNQEARGLLAKPLETGESIIANDPANHPDARGLPPGHPPLTSYLGVPLKRGDRVIGLLRLGNKQGGYEYRDLEDMENLAGAIVEAWMRKRAETTARRQAAIVEGINRIFREALTCETLEDLGRVCLRAAEGLSDSRVGFIDLLNEDGTLDLMAVSDASRQACRQAGKKKFKLPAHVPVRGIYRRVVEGGISLIVNEPASHPDWHGLPKGHPPITSYCGVPLKKGRQVFGHIGLGNREGGYRPRELEAIEALAVPIAEAILHKQAADALQESEESLHFLAGQLLEVQETERRRLSRELHDGLGQSLLVLKFKLSAIHAELSTGQEEARLECLEALQYMDSLINEIRRLSRDLSPGPLEELGLTAALKYLCDESRKHYKILSQSIRIDEVDGIFAPMVESNIYRIFQETLSNIGKHAGATRISASVKKQANRVSFTVRDNGRGFRVSEALARQPGERGIGLASMQERVRMMGGTMDIWSREGKGTRITFTIPKKPE